MFPCLTKNLDISSILHFSIIAQISTDFFLLLAVFSVVFFIGFFSFCSDLFNFTCLITLVFFVFLSTIFLFFNSAFFSFICIFDNFFSFLLVVSLFKILIFLLFSVFDSRFNSTRLTFSGSFVSIILTSKVRLSSKYCSASALLIHM